NIKESINWYTRAAQNGDIKAQYILANIYLDNQDYKKAMYWLDKSADKEPLSLFKLGVIHMNGVGVPKSMVTAVKHFSEGAEKGEIKCQLVLEALKYEKEHYEKEIDISSIK